MYNYVNLCIVCNEPSIIQFVEYDNDDEGDDETYQVESGEGKTTVILITTAGVMNLGIVNSYIEYSRIYHILN